MIELALLTSSLVAAPVPLPEPKRVSADRPGHCERPRWSRDGRHLAYRRWQGEIMEQDVLWDLVREVRVLPEGMAPPGPEGQPEAGADDVWAELGAPGPEGAVPGQTCRQLTWGPAVQPDSFVYSCNVERGYRLFSHRGRQLPGVKGEAAEPVFHPERDEIAFVGEGGIFRMACRRLGRSCGWGRHDPEPLVRGAGAEWVRPVWVQGGRLVVERHDSAKRGDLWVVDPGAKKGAEKRRLTSTAGLDRAPSVAPGGDKVAWFVRPAKQARARRRKASGGQEVWVVALEKGAEPVRVAARAVLAEDGPAWTPDGKSIVYVRDHAEDADPLVAVDVSGRRPRRRVLATGTLSNRDPAISQKDGAWRLAVSAVGREGDDLRRSWRKIYLVDISSLKGE
jgi:hypothetical protein